ncbi:MAG: hypothetical protein EGQ54_04055 [[Ruminococcus] lactaris]|jgi:hypothetical protein|nr:hypothetical protein [[Ruminococcus] lactaris]
MRITKLPNKDDPKSIAKELALQGCDKCPYCGETREWSVDKNTRKLYGIKKNLVSWYGKKCERDNNSFFLRFKFEKYRYWEVVCFKCYMCGAEWESDPYEFD